MEGDDEVCVPFQDMGLDDRLLKAISLMNWGEPTPIQEKAIPLALEGKDILARARTGSGKTGAFCIPAINKILMHKKNVEEQTVKAVILTPSKELCNQAFKNVSALTRCCSRDVTCFDVAPQVSLSSQRPMLMERPDIVVGTPSRLLAHIKKGNLDVKSSLEMIVIDEADLVFSFGHEEDMKELLKHFPEKYQALLMSATLTDEVKTLKKMVLHNPVILKLEESQLPETNQLTQYVVKCEHRDKFALLCALLKLRLIRGKSILFVNSVNKCYKLKLFLEQFGVPTCVLNSELPIKSRCHIVSQFNEGLYDYIIASDESACFNPVGKALDKSHKGSKKDKEYGVSRGIDFHNVTNVINFEFPKTVKSYIHRVGRTARGTKKGTALSFVNVKEMKLLEDVEKDLAEQPGGNKLEPFQFNMAEIEGFRYRSKDAMMSVTHQAIQEARLKEIKSEMLSSQKLKSYFEDNPKDLQVLRHDKPLRTVKQQEHLKHVPDYIVPRSLHGYRGLKSRSNQSHHPYASTQSHAQKRYQRMKSDPLRSFEFTKGRKHFRKK
ncbi:hypothetical protein LOTGIDRAFT_173162 [Lottia gigantea]|uniref:RNA helicase n=1 Tax=Lottia gigantea TaxID=225164 RepID=V4CEN9_LOTGI|nr:hypothetical protein LOTGIDRAFT_173162 [Lottia gigantea]ESP00430.1 hypothetical protein LOTGIDRAFT_173162 [Lottia gigantea]